MKLPDYTERILLVVIATALVLALGIYLGARPGPYQKLARYCDEVSLLRLARIQQLQARYQEDTTRLARDGAARFQDSVRLLSNLVAAVEAQDGERGPELREALQQAKDRLQEWQPSGQ